jgi:glutathione S-transferase
MGLQVVGAKISTFTRTIRLALEYLNIPYDLLETLPHTEIAYKYNSFGKIPTLVDGHVKLIETLSMKRYIDHLQQSSQSQNQSLTLSTLNDQLLIDQWISIASDYAFSELIIAVSKPRQSMESQGKSEEEITNNLKSQIERARVVLSAIENHLASSASVGKSWLCGSSITWADLFMFPIFADLASLPERELIKHESPHLWKWFERFSNTDIANQTFEGTVADIRSKHQSKM